MPSRSSGRPEAVNCAVVGLDRLAGLEIGGDVGDVVAVVGVGRPAGIARLPGRRDAPRPRRPASRSARRRRCSRTRAPPVLPCVSSRLQMASPSAAWRAWPTCSGPVGLAETNSTSTVGADGSAGWRPNDSPLSRISATTRCRAASRRCRLMKPGPATSIDSTQRSTALFCRSAAMSSAATSRGIPPLRLGERHRRGAGEVAVGRLARPLERRDEGIARAHFLHRRAQRVEQFVTGPGHRRILRGGFPGPAVDRPASLRVARSPSRA